MIPILLNMRIFYNFFSFWRNMGCKIFHILDSSESLAINHFYQQAWVLCIILMIMYRVCDGDGVSCRLSLHSWRWSCCLRISIVTRHTRQTSLRLRQCGQLWQTSAEPRLLSGAGITRHISGSASNPWIYEAVSVRVSGIQHRLIILLF